VLTPVWQGGPLLPAERAQKGAGHGENLRCEFVTEVLHFASVEYVTLQGGPFRLNGLKKEQGMVRGRKYHIIVASVLYPAVCSDTLQGGPVLPAQRAQEGAGHGEGGILLCRWTVMLRHGHDNADDTVQDRTTPFKQLAVSKLRTCTGCAPACLCMHCVHRRPPSCMPRCCASWRTRACKTCWASAKC
jgi:hypothetical protein